ncbi:MAG: CBS domain-containing protein [Burkholderiales bacterium]
MAITTESSPKAGTESSRSTHSRWNILLTLQPARGAVHELLDALHTFGEFRITPFHYVCTGWVKDTTTFLDALLEAQQAGRRWTTHIARVLPVAHTFDFAPDSLEAKLEDAVDRIAADVDGGTCFVRVERRGLPEQLQTAELEAWSPSSCLMLSKRGEDRCGLPSPTRITSLRWRQWTPSAASRSLPAICAGAIRLCASGERGLVIMFYPGCAAAFQKPAVQSAKEKVMSTVGEICNREVVVTTRDATIADAARLMRDHHVGTLVVAEPTDGAKRPVGIITDRDLVVEVMAMDMDPRDISVGEVMAPSLVIARDHEDVRAVIERMRYKGVRRLPVMSARGYLVGIVASDDLIKVLAADITSVASITTREQSREVAQRKPVST